MARVAALATAVVVVAAGCSSEREAASAPPASEVAVAGSVGAAPSTSAHTIVDVDTLAMVGDSITVGSQDELIAAFTEIGLPDAEINAQSGRRMVVDSGVTSGLDGVADVLAEGEQPDLWVVALGSNDIAGYAPDDYAGAISELLAAIPAEAPIVWVDCYLTDYEDESVAFDTTLRDVLAARGNATIVDWSSDGARRRCADGQRPPVRVRPHRVRPSRGRRRERLDRLTLRRGPVTVRRATCRPPRRPCSGRGWRRRCAPPPALVVPGERDGVDGVGRERRVAAAEPGGGDRVGKVGEPVVERQSGHEPQEPRAGDVDDEGAEREGAPVPARHEGVDDVASERTRRAAQHDAEDDHGGASRRSTRDPAPARWPRMWPSAATDIPMAKVAVA